MELSLLLFIYIQKAAIFSSEAAFSASTVMRVDSIETYSGLAASICSGNIANGLFRLISFCKCTVPYSTRLISCKSAFK